MEFEIVKIEAKTEVSLYYKKKTIDLRKPIWQKHDGSTTSTYPGAAFLIDQHPAQLDVTVHITNAKIGEKYTLMCFGKMHQSEKETLMFSGSIVISAPGEVVFNTFCQHQPTGFFSLPGEKSAWRLTKENTGESWESNPVNFELYWLYGFDSGFFQRGVPVEILKQVAYACLIMGQSQLQSSTLESKTKKFAMEAVVNSCFYRNPPRYDIHCGMHSFVKGPYYNKMTLELDLYLDSINNPELSRECNCIDMAAVLQVSLMAIGFSNIKYCVMNPFGYMAITNLIGIGLCNNPTYADNEVINYPLVDATNENRSSFGKHAFCRLDEKWILDACIGPHIGNEDAETYVKNVVDDLYPKTNPGSGSVENISYYTGVINIYQVNSSKAEPKLQLARDFKDEVGCTNEVKEEILKYNVVCRWTRPGVFHEDEYHNWEIVYERISPGIIEVSKTLILLKKGESKSIIINIFVSSGGSEFSLNRFLSLGAISNSPKMPYKKASLELSHLAAIHETGNRKRYLWILHNIVFDVTFNNLTSDAVEKLLKRYACEIIEKSEVIEEFLPSTDYIECSSKEPKVGETVTFQMGTPDVIMDFHLEGDGLRFVNETDTSLEFIALKKSENKVLLKLVDKNTLLVNSKEFSINVKR